MTDTGAEMVGITVDGTAVEAEPGRLLIEACEDAGVYIPRFCYHPRMSPVGMCRMCLVEVDSGRGPALQPSCMLTVSDGMVVDTQSEVTEKAQDGVLEFLLINHPLDCPVCDKGGECPLQDQTMAYGPGESRFVESKRHYEKPIPISDIVQLDRERCILCDRCTRFADEVAGDPLIHFQGRGAHTEVNTFPDEPFASYFSGNTVQICPVGALTAKPYRFRARPWDLDEVPSTLPTPMGDRAVVQSSRDQVLRYQGIDSDAVNWSWLADKDRFGFEAMQSEGRLVEPLVRTADGLESGSWSVALRAAADAVTGTLERKGPAGIGILGGARLTNEDQYAWAKLAKGVIGTDNVDAQLADGLPAEVVLGLPRATIAEVCAPGGTIVLMGPDPKEELGTLYLRLRHAVVHDGATLIELTPTAGGLGSIAAHQLHYRPGELGAVAEALVNGTDERSVGGVDGDDIRDAGAALTAGSVTVVIGRASLAEGDGPVVDAAATFLDAIGDVRFLPALRRANVLGALDMGLAPGMLPGRTTLEDGGPWFAERWGSVPGHRGLDAASILVAAATGEIETLILLGADPIADFPDRDLVRRAMEQVGAVICIDLFRNESVELADIVLPAAGFTEVTGSHTNLEGRLSPVAAKVTAPGTARSDWIIAAELADRLGTDLNFRSLEDIWAEIAEVSPAHRGVTLAAIAEGDGLLVPVPPAAFVEVDESPGHGDADSDEAEAVPEDHGAGAADDGEPVEGSETAAASGAPAADPAPPMVGFAAPPRTELPHSDGYSLRLVAGRRMYDAGTHVANCRSLAHLAADSRMRMHPSDYERFVPAADQPMRVTSSKGSIERLPVADPAVPKGSVAVDLNQPDVAVNELLSANAVVTEVRVEST